MTNSTERPWVYQQFSGTVYPPDEVTTTGGLQMAEHEFGPPSLDDIWVRIGPRDTAHGLTLEAVEQGRARIAAGGGVPVAEAARALRGHS